MLRIDGSERHCCSGSLRAPRRRRGHPGHLARRQQVARCRGRLGRAGGWRGAGGRGGGAGGEPVFSVPASLTALKGPVSRAGKVGSTPALLAPSPASLQPHPLIMGFLEQQPVLQGPARPGLAPGSRVRAGGAEGLGWEGGSSAFLPVVALAGGVGGHGSGQKPGSRSGSGSGRRGRGRRARRWLRGSEREAALSQGQGLPLSLRL